MNQTITSAFCSILAGAALALTACTPTSVSEADVPHSAKTSDTAGPSTAETLRHEPVWTEVNRALQPVATDNGERILMLDRAGKELFAYDARGEELWTHPAPS